MRPEGVSKDAKTSPERTSKTGVLCRECDRKESQKTPKRAPNELPKRAFCVRNRKSLKRRPNEPPKRPYCVVNATKNLENHQNCSMCVPRLSIWPAKCRKNAKNAKKKTSPTSHRRRLQRTTVFAFTMEFCAPRRASYHRGKPRFPHRHLSTGAKIFSRFSCFGKRHFSCFALVYGLKRPAERDSGVSAFPIRNRTGGPFLESQNPSLLVRNIFRKNEFPRSGAILGDLGVCVCGHSHDRYCRGLW